MSNPKEQLSRKELRQRVVGWWTDPKRQGDSFPPEIETAIKERAFATEQTRRNVLRKIGLAVGIPLVLDKTGIAVWELAIPTLQGAEIGWMPGQEERLKDADSMLLVFGGATVRKADGLISPVADELSVFGPVGYVEYAHNDFDINGITDRIEEQQKKYPNLQSVSVYGHSLGTHVAGRVLDELEKRGNKTPLKYLFMDCTPPDISYTDQPAFLNSFATFLTMIDGSSIMTAASNTMVYGDPFQERSAPPRLSKEEARVMQKGWEIMSSLAKRAAKDQSKVAFLTPENPINDDVTDAIRSRQALQVFFPQMDTFYLETEIDPETGKEKPLHASPDYHTPIYKQTLAEIRKKWGLVA